MKFDPVPPFRNADPHRRQIGSLQSRGLVVYGHRPARIIAGSKDQKPTSGGHLHRERRAFVSNPQTVDGERLKRMLVTTGFGDVRVTPETRHGTVASFDEYWAAVEAGTGQMPLAYLTLSEAQRRAVREEVRAGLSTFESNGRLELSVEMFIGRGRA